jgi:hypothetical protein
MTALPTHPSFFRQVPAPSELAIRQAVRQDRHEGDHHLASGPAIPRNRAPSTHRGAGGSTPVGRTPIVRGRGVLSEGSPCAEGAAVSSGVPSAGGRAGPAAGEARGRVGHRSGVSETCLRNWVAQADRDEGRRTDGLTTAEREELARLRRELRVASSRSRS